MTFGYLKGKISIRTFDFIDIISMSKGGLRPGSGRPKGRKNNATLQTEEAREILRQMVLEELEPITRAQVELAKGVWYEDPLKGRIYRQKPDKAAAELLLAHAIGKPRETIQQQGEVRILVDL